ncbi:MAG: hypothetical protein JSW23_07385 [Planctomycetota bacterium]|nr:MAG: hypothetical protein JSW23_07385 [Planctomycetota bacterium]
MSDTRRRALSYLARVVGDVPSKLVSGSKFFEPEESWTQKETWWFNLPTKRIKTNKEKHYYLLGRHKKRKSTFVITKVPNKFLIDNLKKLETRYDNKVILHLAAYKENWLVDERGKGRVDFSKFELK